MNNSCLCNMPKLVFLSIALLFAAPPAFGGLSFVSHGVVPQSEANHNIAFGVAGQGGVERFVYASGETLYRAPVQTGLTLGDWTTLADSLTFGDPAFMAVDPNDGGRAIWGDGGSFDTPQPVRLASGLDTAAASFSAPIVNDKENTFDAAWRDSDEFYLAANSPNGGSNTIKLFRGFLDNGAWQTQKVADFGAGFSGGLTVAPNGDVYLGVTDSNTFTPRTYRLTATELDQAVTDDVAVTVDGDDETDSHFIGNFGANGDYAVFDDLLFVSGFRFNDQVLEYNLSEDTSMMHTVTGVLASNVEMDLEAVGDELFVMRRRAFFSSASTVDLFSTTVPEPTTVGLMGLGAAGLILRRRRRAR